MLYLNKEKIIIWSEYYNQFDIYQPSSLSLLKPGQNNLSNQEKYSGPCQPSKMKCLAKKVNA